MSWSAQRLVGVWPAHHWRLSRDTEPARELVVTGEDEDVMHALEALRAYEQPEASSPGEAPPDSGEGTSDCSYCETCDDERWLPNDERDAPEDGNPWKPCPECNPKGVISCPYVFVRVGPEQDIAQGREEGAEVG